VSKKSNANRNPRCKVCLDMLKDDGKCKWDCDPALASPGRRSRAPSGVKLTRERFGINEEDKQRMSNAVASFDKTYASWSNEILARKNHGSR
jgi:hypothetical protein